MGMFGVYGHIPTLDPKAPVVTGSFREVQSTTNAMVRIDGKFQADGIAHGTYESSRFTNPNTFPCV